MVVFIAFKSGCVVRSLRGHYAMSEEGKEKVWIWCAAANMALLLPPERAKKLWTAIQRAKTRNCRKIMERFAK